MPTVLNCLISPILHTPLIKVNKTSGAINIFKSLKNISPKNLNFGTILGIKSPTIIPNRIAIIICFHNANFFIILSPSQYFISPS